MKPLPRPVVLLAGLVLASSSASLAGAAPPASREVKNATWKAKVPAAWQQTVERRFGTDLRQGRWAFRSPKRNGFLRVTTWNDAGEPFEKVDAHYFARIKARVDDVVLTDQKRVKDGADEISSRVFTALMLRNDFMRPYRFAHVVVRKGVEKLLVVVTLGMTEQVTSDFMQVLQTFMDSFEYIGPKAPPPPAAKVEPRS